MDSVRCKEYFKYKYPDIWKKKVKTYGYSEYHSLMLNYLNVRSSDKILECGIGTGEPIAIRIAKNTSNFIGIDISKSLLDDCKKLFKENNLFIHCIQGDIEQIPVVDNFFDKTFCISTTWYVPNLDKAIKEMIRVTKKGGMILFDVINKWHITPLIGDFFKKVCFWVPGNRFSPSFSRNHFEIKRIINNMDIDFKMFGYYVLLPVGLPILKESGNICKYSRLFSFGLSTSPLKYLGEKLVYICRKKIRTR